MNRKHTFRLTRHALAAGLCLPAMFACAASAAELVGSCPGTGDCCSANGTPGCDSFDCCDFVCFIDQDCCLLEWDAACAGFASLVCPDLCGTGCPGSGDCCSANGTPGCQDALCCETVCQIDPTCCDTGWDASCAATAAAVCTDCIPPFDCPGEGDCCADKGTPSCNDATCCEAVCGLDPRCCENVWNADCAVTANLLCGGLGEQYCGFCPGTETCCEFHTSPGCDRASCCDLVCGLDATCCTDRWSLSCRRLALDNCPATVCDCAVPGDFDDNGSVTLHDVAEFMNCYAGPAGGPVETACACADFNGDGTVDAEDVRDLVARLQ